MPFTLNNKNKFSFTPQKIDYGNIPNQVQATMNSVNQTMQNWKNYRQSLGVKTKEEEEAERSQQLEKDKKAALEKSSEIWSELGNSEDVYDWYNAHQPDPQKQAEFAQQGAATAGYLSAIPLTIFSAGTMGWIPAITSTATGFGGAYLGQKTGEYIDGKTGWNTTPWLTFGGGLFGGIGGYKGLTRLATTKFESTPIINGKTLFTNNASNTLYGKQFLSDVIADDLVRGTRPWFKDGKQALQLKLDLNNTDRFVQENFVFPEGTKTLIHGDGVTTGYNNPAKISTIGYGAKKMMTDFPHWKYGKLVPAKSEIVQKHGQRISADKHPLYFSDLEPWYELQQNGRNLQIHLDEWKDLNAFYQAQKFKRATEYPFRFMTIDPNDVKNLDAGYYFGRRGSNEFEAMSIPMDKIKFSAEYDPILKTWGKTQYIDPSASVQTIPKTSYRFYERPSKLTVSERLGIPKGERNNGKILLMQDLVPQKFTSIPGFKPIGGKMIADKVINHPHILDRTRRLQQTYKRIVDPDYTSTDNWRKNRDTSPGMKIVDDIDVTRTNSPTGTTENIGGYYSPSEDVVYVRRRGTPDAQASAAFHEALHGYDFGHDAINDWIIKYLIDPEKVKGMSPRAQKYYLGSQEAPVHALQQGFNKGLDIGAPYPGDTVFDELLDSGIGGSLYYFKTQTPKDKRRLWRAMTGDLFVKKQGGKIENPDH